MNEVIYRGHRISFEQVKDVDDNRALQYFIDGRWHGTVGTKTEALSRAKEKIRTI